MISLFIQFTTSGIEVKTSEGGRGGNDFKWGENGEEESGARGGKCVFVARSEGGVCKRTGWGAQWGVRQPPRGAK